MIWNLPWILTAIPRLILAWSIVLQTLVALHFMTYYIKQIKDQQKYNQRRQFMRELFETTCSIVFVLGGIIRVETRRAQSCIYKQYLGP